MFSNKSFNESLLTISGLRTQFEVTLESIVYEDIENGSSINFTVFNHLIILLSSLLEEWRRLEKMGDNKKLQKSLHTAQPAINRIKVWTGIRKFRSSILAHGLRDKRGNFVDPMQILADHEIPTHYAETWLLGRCAIMAIDVILNKYSVEFSLAVKPIQNSRPNVNLRGISSPQELDAETKNIFKDIQNRLESKGSE